MIKPGTVTNELMSHNDWMPTLCAIAGEPDIVNKLKAGYTANGINYKVHLDGFDQSAFLRNVSVIFCAPPAPGKMPSPRRRWRR